VAIVGVPAEYFTVLGVDIKRRSPFEHTYIAELANDWIGYLPGARIDSVFASASGFPTLADDSLLTGLGYEGGKGAIGGARILLRAAIAALLNEAHPDVDYSVDGVIALVNAALATGDRATMIALGGVLDDANNGADGCPLSGGNTNH
jgi:hypothetical protein